MSAPVRQPRILVAAPPQTVERAARRGGRVRQERLRRSGRSAGTAAEAQASKRGRQLPGSPQRRREDGMPPMGHDDLDRFQSQKGSRRRVGETGASILETDSRLSPGAAISADTPRRHQAAARDDLVGRQEEDVRGKGQCGRRRPRTRTISRAERRKRRAARASATRAAGGPALVALGAAISVWPRPWIRRRAACRAAGPLNVAELDRGER